MAFKMKGFSGFKNVADTGYAGSSAFQAHKKGHTKTKEQLINEGFTPADADRMVKDGATTGKQQNSKMANQADFEPAYEGADYSKDEIKKMSEKEKMAKIDGYSKKKIKAKKSTTSAHGQLSDAQHEYEQDKKMLANKKRKAKEKAKALKVTANQGDFKPAFAGADISASEYKKRMKNKNKK